MTDGVATGLHEPRWGGRGAADAHCLRAVEPAEVDAGGVVDEIRAGIDFAAGLVEHPAVGALQPADEEDDVVTGGKRADVRETVGHLAADGVERAERGGRDDVCRDVVDDAAEAFERLRGLGEEADVAVEVEAFDVLGAFDDDGASGRLTDEADDLSVSRLAIDDKLRVRFLVGHALDAALELQDDGAGGVDDVDAVCACRSVGLRWLTMGAEQHFGVVQAAECCVVYRF